MERISMTNKYDDWFRRAPKHPDLKAGYILDIWAELGYEQSISEKGNHERSNFEDELYDRFGLECENWGERILRERDGYQKVINEIAAAIENV